MAPVTQIDCVTLKDQAGSYEQRVAEFVKISAPRAVHLAKSIERPSQLWTFVDWDSLKSLQSKENDSSIPGLLASLQDKAGFASTSYVPIDASTVFADTSNPVVEVLSMCFPADINDATRDAVDAQFQDFADKALRAPAMCGSITQGWTEKEVLLPGEDDGKTGRILVSLISWPSVEKHMENRDTQAFKDSVHLLRGLPSLTKLDVFHVNYETV